MERRGRCRDRRQAGLSGLQPVDSSTNHKGFTPVAGFDRVKEQATLLDCIIYVPKLTSAWSDYLTIFDETFQCADDLPTRRPCVRFGRGLFGYEQREASGGGPNRAR